MKDYQPQEWLYEPYKKDEKLYNALVAYERYFHFPYPLNLISDATITEIAHAVATDTEWSPDTKGGTIIY